MNPPFLTAETLLLLLPEMLLVALATAVLVGGAFLADRSLWNVVALVGMGLVGLALWRQGSPLAEIAARADGGLLVDQFALTLRWTAWAAGLLFVLVAWGAASDDLASDYLGSLLLLVAGLMVVCSAGDLVLLFMGLELISIPTYILLFLGRRDAASHEATTKYFFLSMLSSGLLLYGFSFLYGIARATDLATIAARLAEGGLAGDSPSGGLARLLPLAMLLIVAGIGFRMTAVPFHFYAPDVYQGTTAGNAGLLAVVPKIAAVVVLVRMVAALPGSEQFGWRVLLGISIATMTLGNTLALWQRNVRRLLAYSLIAHAGYMLMGLTASLAVAAGATSEHEISGLGAMLFYLLIYGVATVGAFAALAWLAWRESEVNDVDDLAGLGKAYPLIAAALALFLFSLAGLPPLGGFWGKLTLFWSVLGIDSDGGAHRAWFVVLAIVGALNAAVAAAYYLRVIGAMYFREPMLIPRAEGGTGAWLSAVISAVLLIAATFAAGPMIRMAEEATASALAPQIRAGTATAVSTDDGHEIAADRR